MDASDDMEEAEQEGSYEPHANGTRSEEHKGRRRSSAVWNFFEYNEIEKRSFCTITGCNDSFPNKVPSNLKQHLIRRHPAIFESIRSTLELQASQMKNKVPRRKAVYCRPAKSQTFHPRDPRNVMPRGTPATGPVRGFDRKHGYAVPTNQIEYAAVDLLAKSSDVLQNLEKRISERTEESEFGDLIAARLKVFPAHARDEAKHHILVALNTFEAKIFLRGYQGGYSEDKNTLPEDDTE